MASFLEQLQQSLKQLENKVNRLEQRIACLEKTTKQEPQLEHAEIEPEIIEMPEKPKVLDWRKFEMNIGNYVLQVVGVILFLLGMGFFLKYSIEQEWLTPTMRFILGLCTATAAIGFGEYLKHYYKQWSLGCIAGGIVLYYLSFYAAFSMYGIFSIYQVFSSFIVTTIFAGLLALWHDSFFIALFSLVGGYCTPLLLDMHLENPFLLAGYILVLALCYLVLSYAKRWYWLTYLSLALIIFYYGHPLVGALNYHQEIVFLVSTWLIFSLIPYLCMYIYPIKKREFESMVVAISTIFVMIGFFYTLSSNLAGQSLFWQILKTITELNHIAIIKVIALISSVVNSIMLIALYIHRPKNTVLMGTLYTLSAASILAVMRAQWSDYNFISALIVFSVVLFGLSFIMQQYRMRVYPYCMWLISGWLLFKQFLYHKHPQNLWFNEINVCIVVIFITMAYALWLSYRNQQQLQKKEEMVPTILEGVLSALPIYLMHTALWKFPYNVLALSWYALLLFFVGIITQRIIIRQCAYAAGFFGASHFVYWYFFKNLLNPHWFLWLNILWISWIAVFSGALLAIRYSCNNIDEKGIRSIKKIIELLLALAIFIWIRSNIILYFDVLNMHGAIFTKRLMGYSVQHDFLVRQPLTNVFLTIFYAIYAVALIFIGLLYQKKELRYTGLSIITLALSKLWFIIMRMPETMQRIVAFMVVGILLIGISFVYQRMSKKIE
jgi:uncharacterized membrane protein